MCTIAALQQKGPGGDPSLSSLSVLVSSGCTSLKRDELEMSLKVLDDETTVRDEKTDIVS